MTAAKNLVLAGKRALVVGIADGGAHIMG